MKKFLTSIFLLFCISSFAQESFRFAVLTDTHVTTPDSPAAGILSACIDDINANKDIDFVIHAGDQTDFGLDSQFSAVKDILNKLNVPLYSVPGNHESTWSESGCTSFVKLFGSERFCFDHKGWRFVGIPCGPDLRMSESLVSRESLRYIDSLDRNDKTIFVIHYPVNDICNKAEFLKLAAAKGTCFFIGGHIHKNRVTNYGGIPGILCRTSKTTKSQPNIGYTVITVLQDHLTACERHAPSPAGEFSSTAPWFDAAIPIPAHCTPVGEPVMGLTYSDGTGSVTQLWSRTEDANIASGFATDAKSSRAFFGTTAGDVRCISLQDGSVVWSTHLGGRIFSTPALEGKLLVVGCSDGGIYALDARSGGLKWMKKAGKAVLASPVIFKGRVYIGASDGCFRCLRVRDGAMVWENRDIKGHVVARAFVDETQVVFGTWGNRLYSLDPRDGRVQWEWTNKGKSVFRSPGACNCVKSQGRIFVSAPDKMLRAFDAASGTPLWKVEGTREAIALSEDGLRVYTKSMTSTLVCSDVTAPATPDAALIKPLWEVKTPVGRDISPTDLVCCGGVVLLPSDDGILFAFDSADGSAKFGFRLSTAMLNPVSAFPDGKGGWKVLVSAADGRIGMLDYRR